MQLNHIVIGTDFSSQSDIAIRHAIAVARASGATLRVAHVAETLGEWPALHAAEERWSGYRQGWLGKQVEPYMAEGVAIEQEVVDAATVALGLESAVNTHHADLLVMGTRGLTALQQTFLGSAAQRALRTVQTNVMIARGEAPTASGYKRVLIPTDFSAPAEKALQLALALAAPDARFDLLHCWHVPEAALADEQSELVIDTIAASVKERGRKLLESFQQDAPNATFSSVRTSPTFGIAKKLESGDYDLVVIGSYGRSKLRRWLLGSVAENTARMAPCTVAVARADS